MHTRSLDDAVVGDGRLVLEPVISTSLLDGLEECCRSGHDVLRDVRVVYECGGSDTEMEERGQRAETVAYEETRQKARASA